MKAILLAGGLGTRLKASVPDLPKPLAPIAGQPFITILMQDLIQQGIDHITLSVGYRHELIRATIGDCFSGVPVHYVVEETPLGTGGALQWAMHDMADEEPCFVFNADTFLKLDLSAMFNTYHDSDIVMALREVEDVARYGRVEQDVNTKKVINFHEKGKKGSGLINAGVYLLQPSLFKRFFLPQHFSLEQDIFVKQLSQLNIEGFVTEGFFIDIGIPEDYMRAQTALQKYIITDVT